MKNGTTLPPIVVFDDGSTYWLADGFHRLMAHVRNGNDWIAADIRQGTRREAALHSVGSNAEHGLPRTNADKRHAVLLLLKDEEWAQWSDREIARRCAVHHVFVGDMRRSLVTVTSEKPAPKTYTNKHGQTATMNTENIGQRKPAALRVAEISALAAEGNRAEQIATRCWLAPWR